MFQQAMETSGLSELLLQGGRYTVLAPTNKAFTYLNQWRLDEMLNDPDRLRKVTDPSPTSTSGDWTRCSTTPTGSER